MQPFETPGMWWLPESPESRVYGTLTCDDAGEMRLKLLGTLIGGSLSQQRDCPVILGVTLDGKGKKGVTLLDCFVTNRSSSFPGELLSDKEELFAPRGYFGTQLSNPAVAVFSRADMGYSGLSSWARQLTGFDSSAPAFSDRWNHPQPIGGEIPGGTVTLGVGCSTSGTIRERRLTETVELVIGFDLDISAGRIETDYVSPLQDFFSFATDHPNALSKYEVTPAGTYDSVTVVGGRIFSDEEEVSNLNEWQMLFTLDDIRDRVPELIRCWLELHKRYRAAFAIYFGALYRPPGYTDLKLSLLLQAISLYFAARQMKQPSNSIHEMDATLPATVRELLEIHPLLTSERALVALMSEFAEHFGPLLTTGGKDRFAEFQEYTVNTLRYTITRKPPTGRYASDGSDLYWLGERIGFLLKMSLLADLGFTSEQISRLLQRNRTYNHIRHSLQPHDGWYRAGK